MESIEKKKEMRERVARLRDSDSSYEDSVEKLARQEDKERERVRKILSKEYGIKETLGSAKMDKVIEPVSNANLKAMEMEKKAWVDELTGLRNKRAFLAEIPQNLARIYKREKKDCSLLILDLDHFKKINDTYGHQAGDVVLKESARLIKEALYRESDVAYRWGGEEFAIFLPDAKIGGAKEVAERIRKKIEEHTFKVTGNDGKSMELKLTVSIGCDSTESSGITKEMKSENIVKKIMTNSDNALYQAKKEGRNRAIAFGEETSHQKEALDTHAG